MNGREPGISPLGNHLRTLALAVLAPRIPFSHRSAWISPSFRFLLKCHLIKESFLGTLIRIAWTCLLSFLSVLSSAGFPPFISPSSSDSDLLLDGAVSDTDIFKEK